MIKVILFDADGVLINGEMFRIRLLEDYGLSSEITKPFFSGPFIDCITGRADLKQVLPPYLKEWKLDKTVEEFLDYWFKSEHNIDQELVETIHTLRSNGLRCYLATNQEIYRIQYMLDKMGFANCFDKIFASAHLGYKKPAQEFFIKIYDELGVNKDEVLFWDDRQENIDAAKQFGINAEIYTDFVNYKLKMKSIYGLLD